MSRPLPAERILKGIVFFTLILVGALQVAACRGLYADGANVLIQILEPGDFMLEEKHRMMFAFLTQFPVVMAVHAGIYDLPFLRMLYAGFLTALPLLFWGLALHQVRKDFLFWPFVMLFCFVYYNAGFMAVSEFNLCFALTACCLACLLRAGPYSLFDRIVLLGATLLYPLEYAATLFLGPILIILALIKLLEERDKEWTPYWFALALIFLTSVFSGLWEVLTPRDPGNFASARDPGMLLSDGLFWILLVYAAITVLTLFMRSMAHVAVALFLCFALLLILFFELAQWDPFLSYGIRLYMTFAFLPCCLFMIGLNWYGRGRDRFGRAHIVQSPASGPSLTLRHSMPVFIVFMILSLFDMDLSLRYRTYIGHFESELNARSGLVPFEQTELQYDSGERLFFRPWTHPTTGLVLRNGSDKAIILNPSWYSGYEGVFDPSGHIPDLNRYYRNTQ